MKKLTDKCCSKCIDSEFQRCPKVTECLAKRPLAECHAAEACVDKREAVIRKIRYGDGILLRLTACSYVSDVAIGNIVKNALEHTQPGGHISVQWTQSPLLYQQ